VSRVAETVPIFDCEPRNLRPLFMIAGCILPWPGTRMNCTSGGTRTQSIDSGSAPLAPGAPACLVTDSKRVPRWSTCCLHASELPKLPLYGVRAREAALNAHDRYAARRSVRISARIDTTQLLQSTSVPLNIMHSRPSSALIIRRASRILHRWILLGHRSMPADPVLSAPK
jgi:hypothetical protein